MPATAWSGLGDIAGRSCTHHMTTSASCILLFGILYSASAFLARAAASASSDLPAFPGAEGFGAHTPGGRGGKVLFVANLDDSGPGSFREACLAQGPRIVIFRVSGTIALKSPITVTTPFLTIAGQTAPGDGICLRDATFGIATHDVVVRHLRSRLGDATTREADALDVLNGSSNVILDHCSATWSIDECLSLSGNNQNITVQWCLIGESLRQSKHTKGSHGYGSLARANGPVSFHHNLWIHNDARNPRMGDNYGRGPSFPRFDVRNNVIYNHGGTASGLTQGNLEVNYVANYIRPGPSSRAKTPITVGNKPVDSDLKFHIRGNIFEGHEELTRDNTKFFSAHEIDGKRQVRTFDQPFAAPSVNTVPARDVVELVLASVGASLPQRDAVDARLVNHVRTRTGKMINSQTEVGGWPALAAAPAPADADNDGMPDAWESKHGLNPRDAADANVDSDQDGYTNIEEYLNATDPKRFIQYRNSAL
jgi:pectate lyase